MTFYDILGYLASAFVVISLLTSNIKYLRYLNMMGCLLFVIYGVLISAYPVAIMNGIAFFINIYHLTKLHLEQKQVNVDIEQTLKN